MASDQDTVQLCIAVQALAARQSVQSIALQEALRSLRKAQGEQCALAIHARVSDLIEAQAVTAIPQADEAIAQELARVLEALRIQHL